MGLGPTRLEGLEVEATIQLFQLGAWKPLMKPTGGSLIGNKDLLGLRVRNVTD